MVQELLIEVELVQPFARLPYNKLGTCIDKASLPRRCVLGDKELQPNKHYAILDDDIKRRLYLRVNKLQLFFNLFLRSFLYN